MSQVSTTKPSYNVDYSVFKPTPVVQSPDPIAPTLPNPTTPAPTTAVGAPSSETSLSDLISQLTSNSSVGGFVGASPTGSDPFGSGLLKSLGLDTNNLGSSVAAPFRTLGLESLATSLGGSTLLGGTAPASAAGTPINMSQFQKSGLFDFSDLDLKDKNGNKIDVNAQVYGRGPGGAPVGNAATQTALRMSGLQFVRGSGSDLLSNASALGANPMDGFMNTVKAAAPYSDSLAALVPTFSAAQEIAQQALSGVGTDVAGAI